MDELKTETCVQINPGSLEQSRNSVYFKETDKLIQNYENKVIYSYAGVDPQEKIILAYNTKKLNEMIKRYIASDKITPETYVYLYQRLEELPLITEAELYNFFETTVYVPRLFIGEIENRPINVLIQLNNYFSPESTITNSKIGSFCSMASDVFGLLGNAQSLFNSAVGFFGRIQEIISQIQDITAASIIEQLRQNLLSAFDSILQNFISSLDSFGLNFMNTNYLHNMNSSMSRYRNLMNRARAYTDSGVVDNMRNRIEGLVAQASNMFQLDTLSIDEALFMLMRFCEFSRNIEGFFNRLLRPLEIFQENYTDVHQRLVSAGNLATAGAINVGALRYPTQQRMAGEQAAASIPAAPRAAPMPNSHESATIPSSPTTTPAPDIYVPGSPGSRDPNVIIPGVLPLRRAPNAAVAPATPAEVAAIPSYEQVRNGHNGLNFGGSRESWERAQTLEIVMLMRLQRVWGETLNISNAFRNSGARRSWHKSGQAFDIGMGIGRHVEFLSHARYQGFGGCGSYNRWRQTTDGPCLDGQFVHIDSGPARTWNGSCGGANLSGLPGLPTA